jgi:hypothetical protein
LKSVDSPAGDDFVAIAEKFAQSLDRRDAKLARATRL